MISVNNYLDNLRSTVKEVDVVTAFKEQQLEGILIDIREKEEVQSGTPINSTWISKGTLEMQIQQVAPKEETPIYLLCASGRRSLVSASTLNKMGYRKVYSVKGGFNDWKNHSLPFAPPRMLDEDASERYKRHLLIPELGQKGQLKLLDSKVLIVGAGGIGSPTAFYLAAAGIGHLGIIDNDIVDRTNLQRQILHTDVNVNTPKVDSAKERLSALNPKINIQTYQKRLTADNIEEILAGYDLVIDGTDNFTTRYLINDASVKLNIPNIHGSVFRFEGQVSTFWPSSKQAKAPCYRCLYPSPPPPELAPSCAEAGVLGVLPGLVGLICATEAIKVLADFGNLLIGKLLCLNALNWSFEIYEVAQDENCAYCGCTDATLYPAYKDYQQVCSVG